MRYSSCMLLSIPFRVLPIFCIVVDNILLKSNLFNVLSFLFHLGSLWFLIIYCIWKVWPRWCAVKIEHASHTTFTYGVYSTFISMNMHCKDTCLCISAVWPTSVNFLRNKSRKIASKREVKDVYQPLRLNQWRATAFQRQRGDITKLSLQLAFMINSCVLFLWIHATSTKKRRTKKRANKLILFLQSAFYIQHQILNLSCKWQTNHSICCLY